MKRPVTVTTGFWSPLMVITLSAVITSASLIAVVCVKRGKHESLSVQDDLSYKPRASVRDTPLYNYRSSVPSMKSTTPAKISQRATSSLKPPFTKVCKHCQQNVRDDLNVCPYCFKRLR
jgi:hypothetical protein